MLQVTGHVENSLASSQAMESSAASIQLGHGHSEAVLHKFSPRVGVNINLCDGGVSARRKSPAQSLVFSAHCLEAGELFEVKITELDPVYR